jgi:hypothetical protein
MKMKLRSHKKMSLVTSPSTEGLVLTIPKGLRPKAQGCEERATLGNRSLADTNPNGVTTCPAQGAPQPRWGCPSRGRSTQGSSFLTTLGFGVRIPLGFTRNARGAQ